MRLVRQVLVAALSLAALPALAPSSAMPSAEAQWVHRGRRHERPAPPASIFVDSVSPQRTVPGGRVVIRGAGFDASTQIFVGGRPVSIESIRYDAIVFVAPYDAGDGSIVIRDPRAGDHVIGALALDRTPRWSSPSIARVRVDPHDRGTRVVIDGDGFVPGDEIQVGGVRADIHRMDDRRIVAMVPLGAYGAVALVRTHDGRRYETGAVIPAPVRREVPGYGWPSPRYDDRGRYGDGYGYGYDDRYRTYEPYDPYALRARPVAPVQLGSIHVRGRRGGDVLVVVTGSGFGPDAQAFVGGVAVPVISRSETQLVLAIPGGVSGSQRVEVTTRGQRVMSGTQVVLPR